MTTGNLRKGATAALLWTLGSLNASAQGSGGGLHIRSVEKASEAALEIIFEEAGESFDVFKIETSIDLSDSVGAWTELQPISLEPTGAHTFKATVAIIENENRFFRITGQGTPSDTDGDGVSNADEESYGTNPNLPDTDEDGFSDGVEIAAGTAPDDDQEKPDFSFLPAVRFTLQRELIEEGNYSHSVLLQSDKPIFGQVNYTVSVISNVATGGPSPDASLISNTVTFSGQTSAEIALTIRDDSDIENIETLIFDLENTQDGSYRTGAVDQHILLIEDNDAYWTATIFNGGSETSFRMLLLEEDGTVTGKIVSAEGNESGVVPTGEWDLSVTKTSNSFQATAEPIPMTSALLIDAELERRISIRVVPPADPDNIGDFEAYYFQPNRMVGTLTDQLMAAEEDQRYLNQESLNLIVMVRDTPQAEEIEIPNVPE